MPRDIICIQQVSLLFCNHFTIIISLHIFVRTYVCTYNIVLVDVSIAAEKLTALSSVDQFDYSQIENSTHQCCVVHDGASDDRAEKCSVRSYSNHRR